MENTDFISNAVAKCDNSMFKLVMLAVRRAHELEEGLPPLIETKRKNSQIIALQEIAEGVVYIHA